MGMRRWFIRYSSPRQKEVALFVKSTLGFTPKFIANFEEALRHSSAKELNHDSTIYSNERLEYLGDAILDSVVAEYLFHHFPDQNEGQLTKLKSKVVSRKNLNELGRALGLKSMLDFQLGKNDVHDSLLGNAFEALAGAMYLDQGYKSTYSRYVSIFEQNGLHDRLEMVHDYKSKLHEWCQKRRLSLRFVMEEEQPEKGYTIYHMAAVVDDKVEGRGSGKSKKQGEQTAAKQACVALME